MPIQVLWIPRPLFTSVVTVANLHLVCLVGVTSLPQYDSRFEKEHWAQRFPIIEMIQR